MFVCKCVTDNGQYQEGLHIKKILFKRRWI